MAFALDLAKEERGGGDHVSYGSLLLLVNIFTAEDPSMEEWLTRDNIASISFVFVFHKAESVHELDFTDSARTFLEMSRDIFLSDCVPVKLSSA